MYKRIDPETNNISRDFLVGVEQFMNFASSQAIAQSSGGRFYCPCVKCQNLKFLHGMKISNHLHSRGFMPDYYVWSEHGEDYDVLGGGTSSQYGNNIDYTSGTQPIGFDEGNVYVGMVNDAFHGSTPLNEYHHEHETGYDHVHDGHTEKARRFYDMLDAANTSLYDGCHEGHSKLSLAARFMNIKVDHNLSETCMDSWAEFFTEYLMNVMNVS
ncbi:hypothetical protein V5N11_027828 [Cardamine amara subsp. amara]|uniref:Transposase-associated domain-containing protein n=1 Tax=Cardamine amara subsp. amara TaxID=228776 RepID=A0ABD0ZIY2_CARAN